MKRLIMLALSLTLLCLVGSLASSSQVAAASPFDAVCAANPDSAASTVCNSKDKNANPVTGPNGVAVKVIEILNIVIGVTAVVVIIVSGIRLVISSGDPASISGAKNAILYAVVGLVIAVTAQTIVVFVVKRL